LQANGLEAQKAWLFQCIDEEHTRTMPYKVMHTIVRPLRNVVLPEPEMASQRGGLVLLL
jgi:hypothetical protein